MRVGGEDGRSWILEIRMKLMERKNERKLISYPIQRISKKIQRGNAICISLAMPSYIVLIVNLYFIYVLYDNIIHLTK